MPVEEQRGRQQQDVSLNKTRTTAKAFGRGHSVEGEKLADVYDDESYVVLLTHRGGLPRADLAEQSSS